MFGFTSKEIEVIEALGAKHNVRAVNVLRQALRLYQANDGGLCRVVWNENPVGCPDMSDRPQSDFLLCARCGSTATIGCDFLKGM